MRMIVLMMVMMTMMPWLRIKPWWYPGTYTRHLLKALEKIMIMIITIVWKMMVTMMMLLGVTKVVLGTYTRHLLSRSVL